MVSHGPRSGFALIKGVIPADERGVSNLLDSITTGSAKGLEPGLTGDSSAGSKVPDLVLGKDLAEQLGVQIGDQMMVTSPQGHLNPVIGLVPNYQPFRVAGIFHSGFYQYDSAMAFTSLAVAQHLFDEPDLLSIISFKIDNPDHAPEVALQLSRLRVRAL